jgi:hypothetical protein
MPRTLFCALGDKIAEKIDEAKVTRQDRERIKKTERAGREAAERNAEDKRLHRAYRAKEKGMGERRDDEVVVVSLRAWECGEKQ